MKYCFSENCTNTISAYSAARSRSSSVLMRFSSISKTTACCVVHTSSLHGTLLVLVYITASYPLAKG